MTELAIKYVANPFAGFARKIMNTLESIGRARAAARLAEMGYHKEARNVMLGKGAFDE